MQTARRPQVALAFMAHPDDAEIFCGGTLIRLRERGWDVHIASCTAGDLGSATLDPWSIASIRIAEAHKAAGEIDASYHCLGERDAFVLCDRPAMQKAYDLFRRIAPDLVLTHAPRDYMLDHEQASMLARAASFIYSAPYASQLPSVAGSSIPYLYYVDPMEGKDALGEDIIPTTVVDISAVMDRKARMLACHASQREWLRAHHGMDEYLDAMRRHAETRGRLLNVHYAEGFVQHRGHAYPHNDLLTEILGQPEKEP